MAIAQKEIGTKESPANSNKTKYGEAYGWNGVAWCVIFMWWCFAQAGAQGLFYGGKKVASCGSLRTWAKSVGQWVTSNYKRGDLVIFDLPNTAYETDHIGIVESVSGQYLTTIEGNTSPDDNGSQSNGGMVCRKRRHISIVNGAYRPKYEVEKTTLPTICKIELNEIENGSKGNTVKALQTLLNGYGYNCGTVDGDFGIKTQTAVKAYQKAKGLDVDGVVGVNTWGKLLK